MTVNRPEAHVSVMGIHHLHVRSGPVVVEWAELDELALHARLHGATYGRSTL